MARVWGERKKSEAKTREWQVGSAAKTHKKYKREMYNHDYLKESGRN